MEAPVLKGKKLALISILRAGNGLLDGVLELVPSARVGFIGLYRDEATLQPVQYYSKVPADLDERVTIALDPMLATGNSSAAAVTLLKEAGATDIRFLCLLAAPEGVARMKAAHPDVRIVTAALDRKLNDKGYIVPGLGDAGDRHVRHEVGGSPMHLEGSCHCGAVRFSVEAPHPYPFALCYCSICRKTAGAGGFAINIGAETAT